MQALVGTWYEIGKVQTFGGAIFEGSCVCTQLKYTSAGTDGSATVSNICREKTPQGKLVVANATISPKDGQSGSFVETFVKFVPGVDYTIVALEGEEYMVEFDCSSTLGIINYCFHVMSRKPTLDAGELAKLKDLMAQNGLNPHNITWKVTAQDGCWDNEGTHILV